MAGRKSGEPNFFSTLLGKLGLTDRAEPAKSGKKGTKRRRKRPDAASPEHLYGDLGVGADDAPSPFATYGEDAGLMDAPTGFADTLTYEAAAAAGYAPPTPEPAVPSTLLRPLPPARPAPLPVASHPVHAPQADGRLFSEDALDTSLDALFSGLENGLVNPPLPTPEAPAPLPAVTEKPLFDEFGLTPVVPREPEPVAEPEAFHAPDPFEAPPAPAAPVYEAPTPSRTIHKPIVAEPGPGSMTPPIHRPEAPSTNAVSPPPRHMGGSLGAQLPPPVVLVLAEGVDLNALFQTLERLPNVAGSLLVGYDGLLIMATLSPELDGDFLGALACNLFMSNSGQLAKMKRPELRRIVLETASGAMLMTAADMGILVVVSQEGRAMDIAGIMGAIGGALGRS